MRLKKYLILLSAFIPVFFSYASVNASEYMVDTEDKLPSLQWRNVDGRWQYLDGDGNECTGWNYVPLMHESDKFRWLYFSSEGFLVVQPGIYKSVDINMWEDPRHKAYVESLINEPVSDLTYTGLATGWYSIRPEYMKDTSLATLVGDDNIPYGIIPVASENDLSQKYYIKALGNNDYQIISPFGQMKKVVGIKNGSVIFADKNEADSEQIWNIASLSDGTFIFINKKTGCVMETLSLSEDGKDKYGDYHLRLAAYSGEKIQGFSLNKEQLTIESGISNDSDADYSGDRISGVTGIDGFIPDNNQYNDEYSDYLTPEAFGAVGDGIHDDSFAIWSAVNSGEPIVFRGRYKITQPVDIETPGACLIGAGGTIVTNPNNRIFQVRATNVSFEALTFKGNYSKDEASVNSCIFIFTYDTDPAYFDFNTRINNCSFIETGLRGVHMHSARPSNTDITPTSIVRNVYITDCEFDTYEIGVCCSGPDNVVVDNCTFRNAYYEHITFDWRSRYCKAIGNEFLGGEHGVGAIGVDTAVGCEIINNDFITENLYGISMNNETGVSDGIIISGNTFTYSGGRGGIQFQGRKAYGVSANNVTVTGNTFNTGPSESVVMESSGGNIVFSGNSYNTNTPKIISTDGNVVKDF